ncbi:hypothetical protein [Streptomyces sp. NPDC097981]|uniref:hypothetical protein n=1 Tax=Streptomyces sp. NPDC097981 TaxID=3155428 RepID=UPI0033235CED
MRTSRIRTTAAAAAAATAALTLALTAVGGAMAATGGAGGTDGTVPRAMAHQEGSVTVKPTPMPTPKPKPTRSYPEQPRATSAPSYPGHPAHTPGAVAAKVAAKPAADVRQCDGTEMSYSVLHRFPGERGEHLLITAKNTDAKPCWATSYPSIMRPPGRSSSSLAGGLAPCPRPGGRSRAFAGRGRRSALRNNGIPAR